MSRRGDNIHKRKDGRWEGRYISGRNADGKARYSSVYASNYADCSEKLKLARCGLLPGKKSLIVSELFSMWLLSKKNIIKQSTYVNYKYLFDTYLLDSFGAIRVDSLNTLMFDRYIEGLLKNGGKNREGLSAHTVRAIMTMLHSVLEYAEQEYALANPVKKVSFPNAEKSEIIPFTSDEMMKIRYAAINGDSYKLGILLSLYTGLRIGELCALTWNDVDIKNQLIYVKKTLFRIINPNVAAPKTIIVIDTPKSRCSIREIPIPTFMVSALENLKFDQQDSNYFLTCSHKYTEPRTYSCKYKAFLKNLNIPYRNFHNLRHTFATECVKQGVDVKTLSELLGHSSVKITLDKYVHSDMDLKRQQLKKLYALV